MKIAGENYFLVWERERETSSSETGVNSRKVMFQ